MQSDTQRREVPCVSDEAPATPPVHRDQAGGDASPSIGIDDGDRREACARGSPGRSGRISTVDRDYFAGTIAPVTFVRTIVAS